MEYRNMKDAKVSLLGFGCMRFPVREDGKIDRPRSFKMLDAAYDAGVTYYDTAYPYHAGESELVVGEWQKTKPRESLLIATKYPSWELKEAGDIEKTLNEQLSKLQTDYIDFYLLHALNTERWEKYKSIGIFKILDDLKAKGLVRHIGFRSMTTIRFLKKSSTPITGISVKFSSITWTMSTRLVSRAALSPRKKASPSL